MLGYAWELSALERAIKARVKLIKKNQVAKYEHKKSRAYNAAIELQRAISDIWLGGGDNGKLPSLNECIKYSEDSWESLKASLKKDIAAHEGEETGAIIFKKDVLEMMEGAEQRDEGEE